MAKHCRESAKNEANAGLAEDFQSGNGLKFYHRNVEVDFYVPDEGLAVQACWLMADAETRIRELGALEKLDARSPLKRMVVVTREESERVELPDGRIVEIMPLAEWLLEMEERR